MMADEGVDVAEPGGMAQEQSICVRLFVSDPSGLMVAPLDAADIGPVDVDELVLTFAETRSDALPLAAVGPGAPQPLGEHHRLAPMHPVVLRHQDHVVLAWNDQLGRYVALGADHLAVVDQLRGPMSGHDLIWALEHSDWPTGRGAALTAAAELAELGVIEASLEEPASADDSLGPGFWARQEDPEAVPDEQCEPGTPSGREARRPDAEAPIASVFEGLPGRSAAVRVVAYRVVGRTRRKVRRRWVATGRRSAQALRDRFGQEGDDWPVPELLADVETEPRADASAEADGDATPAGDDRSEHDGSLADLGLLEAHERLDAPLASSVPVSAVPPDHRTPVFGVYHSPEHNANLGLGLIIAHARVVDQGALNVDFDLRRPQIDAEPMLEELERTGRHAVVLCSDYMWSLDHNLGVSARVKELNGDSVTVHGGPHAPKYAEDAERFLAEHPHVDILVRSEGELTVAALLAALGPSPDPTRLGELLSEVQGLTFRDGPPSDHRVVRTEDRSRAAEMGQFPSPYLTGEFADVDPERWRSATVETNRGCPYGCTFCDWGSATNSRIRQFDRDRVFAELEWLAARGISEVFLADANFGLFARDVEVAQHIAELKQRYGAPTQIICSFAKNTVKYTAEIVKIWVEAGICAEGSVALQTTDEVTLKNVERSNIKVEKYDALAEEFRSHRLPIVTDLLMGLPGATVESFKNDLQRCLDQEVTPRMMETVLLPNSPMNAPEYRERFAVEVDDANVLVSTSSYTRSDFEEMKRLRLLFRACEHYGLLRHLFRWLQVEHGIRALDLVHDIDRAIIASPERYPLLTWVGRYFDLVTAPPGGWPPFYDEVVDLLAQQYGIERDAAMDTVLAVQCFLMPSHGRSFPDQLQLDHDYVGWYQATSRWADPALRPRLIEMGPGELVVDDPAGVCDARLLRNGFSIRREEACDNPFWVLNDWELDSELARPMATAVPLLTTS